MHTQLIFVTLGLCAAADSNLRSANFAVLANGALEEQFERNHLGMRVFSAQEINQVQTECAKDVENVTEELRGQLFDQCCICKYTIKSQGSQDAVHEQESLVTCCGCRTKLDPKETTYGGCPDTKSTECIPCVDETTHLFGIPDKLEDPTGNGICTECSQQEACGGYLSSTYGVHGEHNKKPLTCHEDGTTTTAHSNLQQSVPADGIPPEPQEQEPMFANFSAADAQSLKKVENLWVDEVNGAKVKKGQAETLAAVTSCAEHCTRGAVTPTDTQVAKCEDDCRGCRAACAMGHDECLNECTQ